jgi:antitoxin component YwqK of YwqJK toxin-antitoxin module
MNIFVFAVALLMPLSAYADIITLKDGTRLEGVIDGEMEGVALVRTQYGALNIKKSDIVSQVKAEQAPVTAPPPQGTPAAATKAAVYASTTPAAPAPELPTASTEAVVDVSSAPLELPAAPPPAPEYTFKTVTLSTMAYEKDYFENGISIATELFDAKGELMGVRGSVKDATYKEYYENGNIKTEKTMINAKSSGPLKAYYPGGLLQSEAYYLDGLLNGSVRVYNESGKLLFEQNFQAGVPNGYFREFDGAGALKSELFYVNGHLAEKPAAAGSQPPAAAETPESSVTAISRHLARGERITFHLNNKYVAKLQLDKDFNVISRDGNVPDGAVKIYDKAGGLEKELVFAKNEMISVRTYAAGGALKAEFYYKDGKAIKK